MGYATFPLLCCHACDKWKFVGLREDARESRVEVVEGGVPLHNRARVQNNSKIEDLIIE